MNYDVRNINARNRRRSLEFAIALGKEKKEHQTNFGVLFSFFSYFVANLCNQGERGT